MANPESTEWCFPPLSGGEATGFRDAGIALFSTDAIRSMTREVLQNAIDAVERLPVRVTFSRLLVPTVQIPNVEQLRAFLERCLDDANVRFTPGSGTWMENGGDAAKRAVALLTQPAIPVMRIRDENTKGLTGVDGQGMEKEDSNWDRLVRKKGSPHGNGPQGGSFGIGQRAPFAASTLRTLFYGTKTATGFAFIGKSIWWSIPLTAQTDEDRTQNVGYWGRTPTQGKRVRATTAQSLVPEVFRRESQGTDLYLLGFHDVLDPSTTWRDSVLDAVLINYFAAIQAGRLEIGIDDGPTGLPATIVTSGTIITTLEARLASAAKPSGKKKHGESYEDLVRARFFLSALTDGQRYDGLAGVLGKVRLHVYRKEGAPNRIAWMRSPLMLVSSTTNNTMKDYAAVFVCDDEEGNKKLRSLEGPEHNHWDNKIPARREIIYDRNEFVRSVLDKLAGLDTVEEQDVPQLSAYLPEDLPAGGAMGTGPKQVTEHQQTKETGRRVARRGKLTVAKGRQPPPTNLREPEDGTTGVGDGPDGAGGSGDGGGQGGGTESGGPNPGSGRGDLGEGAGNIARLRPGDIRYRTWFASDGDCIVLLHSRRSGQANISVRVVGAEGPPAAVTVSEAVDLATQTNISRAGGTLVGVTLHASTPLRLKLRLDPPRRAALNLEVLE